MNAGELDARITLQRKAVTRDSYGGEDIVWMNVATVWAATSPWRLREKVVARRNQGDAVVSFLVRAPLDVSLDKRVLWNDVAYNIVEIDVTRKRQGEIMFMAIGEDLNG